MVYYMTGAYRSISKTSVPANQITISSRSIVLVLVHYRFLGIAPYFQPPQAAVLGRSKLEGRKYKSQDIRQGWI